MLCYRDFFEKRLFYIKEKNFILFIIFSSLSTRFWKPFFVMFVIEFIITEYLIIYKSRKRKKEEKNQVFAFENKGKNCIVNRDFSFFV